MAKLEIKEHPNGYKVIYVDDVFFDWGLSPEDVERARKFAKNSNVLKQTIQNDIQRHFLDSFAEFLGKTVSLQELNEAIENGAI